MILDYENMHDISRFYQQIGWGPGVLESERVEGQKTHIVCRMRIESYHGFARRFFGIYILDSLWTLNQDETCFPPQIPAHFQSWPSLAFTYIHVPQFIPAA